MGKQLIILPFSANNHLLSSAQSLLFYVILSFPISLFFLFIVSISAFLVLKLPFFPHSPLSHWSTTKMQDRGECEGALEFHMQRVNTVTARKTHTHTHRSKHDTYPAHYSIQHTHRTPALLTLCLPGILLCGQAGRQKETRQQGEDFTHCSVSGSAKLQWMNEVTQKWTVGVLDYLQQNQWVFYSSCVLSCYALKNFDEHFCSFNSMP